MPENEATNPARALLVIKLYVPKPHRRVVPRPRLMERLDRGAESALTLVSAPAGFGKSTLLSDWVATEDRAVAWLSLDAADNDPSQFWTYFVAALRTTAPTIGSGLPDASQLSSVEDLLTGILNDISVLERELVLVLDDYHVIESRGVHEGMAFLLDHMPAQLHVMIASRADPPLPLARLRGRGELVEVRAGDLRFTAEEAAAYFTEVMGLTLEASDVSTLSDRTEGWIAALQLAALSMQGRSDLSEFVAGFAGDDRYIVDYLVEEVLQSQPAPVRTFLLETSILNRMNASLCDAVHRQGDGKALLETLDRANLFLVPLDDRRRWYRYHHLFAEMLQARLLDEYRDEVPELHRRASAWYSQHGETDAAIHHALAASDHALAAHLIEAAHLELTRDRRESTLREWMEMLPVETFRNRPVLSLAFVGALLSTDQVDGVEPRLRDAERWVESGASGAESTMDELVVVDQEEYRRLPASIAIYRSGLALALGDADRATEYAVRALELISDDDPFRHGAASALYGLTLWGSGALDQAHDAYSESVACFRRSGHVADVLGCTIMLADVRMTQGRLSDAMASYTEAIKLAGEQGGPKLRGVPDMHVGVSEILRERGNVEGAASHLALARELGDYAGLRKYRYRSRVAMAQLLQMQGDLDGAVDLLDEAERAYVADMAPNVRPVGAYRARALLAQGRIPEVTAWAREQKLSAGEELSYLREFEHITLVRLLLAQYRLDAAVPVLRSALTLLDRLGRAAESGGRTGNLIEILVLHSLAHQLGGDLPAALISLKRALDLAELEGYVRIFVDEGAPMKALLNAVAGWASARRLLAFFGDFPAQRLSSGGTRPDPLSEREREVLRLLGTELSGPEIARHLVVSLNTVRTHMKNIYTKLGVTSRRAAVRRAEELGNP